jgi:hypothetical protein
MLSPSICVTPAEGTVVAQYIAPRNPRPPTICVILSSAVICGSDIIPLSSPSPAPKRKWMTMSSALLRKGFSHAPPLSGECPQIEAMLPVSASEAWPGADRCAKSAFKYSPILQASILAFRFASNTFISFSFSFTMTDSASLPSRGMGTVYSTSTVIIVPPASGL